MVTDAAGTEIVPGSVVTWCGRQSSSLFLSVGVVREVESHPNQWDKKKTEYVLKVDRLGTDRQIKHTDQARYLALTHYYRKVLLTIPSYITVTGMTEEDLKTRFPFEEQLEVLVKR